MEGIMIATSEIAVIPIPTAAPKSEGMLADASKTSDTKVTEIPKETPEKTTDADTDIQDATIKTEDKVDKPEQNLETNAEEALTDEQISEEFNELWDGLDNKTKGIFTKLLKEDKEKKDKSMLETSIALLRAFKLMFAFIRLMIFEQKEFYSGKDLDLSDSPPEGTQNHPTMDSEKDPEKSWKNFRKEVEEMEPMPFGEFMNHVFAANAKHSDGINKLTPKKEENDEAKLQLLKLLLKNKSGEKTPQSSRRMLSRPRGKSPRS